MWVIRALPFQQGRWALQSIFKLKWLGLLLLLLMTVGFRTYPGGNLWRVGKDDPKIWLKFCGTFVPEKNDTVEGDALYGETITHTDLVDSITDDFTDIPGSYLELVNVAGNTLYEESTMGNRTIDICFDSMFPTAAGHANWELDDDGKIKKCSIKLSPKIKDRARQLIGVLTHEIGHCLGLDHPQESYWAIMSYFNNPNVYRLMDDDRAGVVYLFPNEPGDVAQIPNWGLACSTRD